jgi:hypothetical protein
MNGVQLIGSFFAFLRFCVSCALRKNVSLLMQNAVTLYQ